MSDWRGFWTGVVLALAVVVLAGCGNYNAWHQKLIVTVETPDGVKTGSSVVLVGLHDTTGNEWMTLPEARGARYELTGEAVVLEVAPGRYLFALLKGLPYATNALFPDEPPVEIAPSLADMRASRELSPNQYPLLVTFADIDDPASVQRLDPDDLDASLGCDTPQTADAFPWRGQGKTWRQWQEVEALEQARQAAAHEARLPAGISVAMIEADKIMDTHVKKTKEELARLRVLQSQFTYKQFDAWRKAKWKLQRQFTLASRDTSHDCHRLTSITLVITDEPVTQGRVEAVLGWLGNKQLFERIWPSLSSDIRSLLSSVNWRKG